MAMTNRLLFVGRPSKSFMYNELMGPKYFFLNNNNNYNNNGAQGIE